MKISIYFWKFDGLKAKTEQLIESGKEVANTAIDKAADATQSAKESANEASHETSGFLQQVLFISRKTCV